MKLYSVVKKKNLICRCNPEIIMLSEIYGLRQILFLFSSKVTKFQCIYERLRLGRGRRGLEESG